MKTILIAATLLALAATPVLAGDDDALAGYFGNTVISTGGMAEVHTHYRADHTFDLTGSMLGMSKSFKGTWATDGKGNLCRTFVGDVPPNTPNPLCRPLLAHKVGDTWTVTMNGTTSTLTMKAGVQ
jgi:hypothetical protein